MYSKKDSLTLYGDEVFYFGEEKRAEVFGNAVIVKPLENGDTLFLSADTLYAFNDSINNNRKIIAQRNVRLLTKEMAGVCDSLVVDMVDSMIYFRYNPILWNNENQLTADTVTAKLKESSIDSLWMNKNAFIVSKNDLKKYDQISGRDMVASFKESSIQRVDVNGNGESIFYADDEGKLVGMNDVDCSNMIILFADSNKVSTIDFLTDVNAKFIPPHELKSDDERLANLNWQLEKKPTRLQTLRGRIVKNEIDLYLDKCKQLYVGRYELYIDEKENTLIYFKGNASKGDLQDSINLDIFPSDPKDLKEELQRRYYETQTFLIPETAYFGKIIFYKRKLPAYTIATIRTGQFQWREYKEKNKQIFIWEHVFNMYDLGSIKTNNEKREGNLLKMILQEKKETDSE